MVPGAHRPDGGVAPDQAAVGRGRRGRPCQPAGPCPRGGRHRRRRRGPDPARRERTRPRVQPRDGQRRQLAGFDLPDLRTGSERDRASPRRARRSLCPGHREGHGRCLASLRPAAVGRRSPAHRSCARGRRDCGSRPATVRGACRLGRTAAASSRISCSANWPSRRLPSTPRASALRRGPPSRSAGRAGRPCPGARFRARRPRCRSGSRGRAGR